MLRNNKRIKKYCLTVLAITMLLHAGCGTQSTVKGSSPEPVTGENYYLDTICTISIYAMHTDDAADTSDQSAGRGDSSLETAIKPAAEMKDDAEAAISSAFDRCAELDKKLSRTQAASEISKVNNAGGEWVDVSDETIELVKAGIDYSELSDGDFDITIGGVTDMWDFHADPEDAKVPDAYELAEAVKHVDYNNIEIDGNKLRIKDPEAKIDLGGIAKGYIGDRMTEVLEELGVTSGIINLGGNVICIGGKYTGGTEGKPVADPSEVSPDEPSSATAEGSGGSNADDSSTGASGVQDFVIGVEAPFSDRTEIVGKVNTRDKTLVTSGVYERKIEVDGKLYHHILDTDTGYSAETDLDAVTLAADKGRSMDLDALSTICLIKGYSEASKLIEKTDGVEAVFILADGTIRQTSGMQFEEE